MRILHFYDVADSIIERYVDVLSRELDAMPDVASRKCDTLKKLRQGFKDETVDIVHFHGCWAWTYGQAYRFAISHGARAVFSPHGLMEPWILQNEYLKQRLPHLLLYLKALIHDSYAVICQGNMERESFAKLRLTHRIEVVASSLITATTTDSRMAADTLRIYRKVMCTNVRALLSASELTAFGTLLKTAVLGHADWLTPAERQSVTELTEAGCERLMLHGRQAEVADYVTRGFAILQVAVSGEQAEAADYYLPDGSMPMPADGGAPAAAPRPTPATTDNRPRRTELEELRSVHKAYTSGRLTARDIAALADCLYHSDTDEARLAVQLKDAHISKFTARLMAFMQDAIGFDEGYMPVAPKGGKRQIRKIRAVIADRMDILL